jgi:hypothetical protein
LAPIVDGLEAEFGDEMIFTRLDANVAENAGRQTALGVRGHPSIAIVNADGVVTARFFGPEDVEILRKAIEEACPACRPGGN